MAKTKEEIIQEYALHGADTGSIEVQVALITDRINSITEHLKKHRKDHSTRRGLLKLVGQRNSFLKYLQKKDFNRYVELINSLGLRK